MQLYSGHGEENAHHTQVVGLMLLKEANNALMGWELHGPNCNVSESVSVSVEYWDGLH